MKWGLILIIVCLAILIYAVYELAAYEEKANARRDRQLKDAWTEIESCKEKLALRDRTNNTVEGLMRDVKGLGEAVDELQDHLHAIRDSIQAKPPRFNPATVKKVKKQLEELSQ